MKRDNPPRHPAARRGPGTLDSRDRNPFVVSGYVLRDAFRQVSKSKRLFPSRDRFQLDACWEFSFSKCFRFGASCIFVYNQILNRRDVRSMTIWFERSGRNKCVSLARLVLTCSMLLYVETVHVESFCKSFFVQSYLRFLCRRYSLEISNRRDIRSIRKEINCKFQPEETRSIWSKVTFEDDENFVNIARLSISARRCAIFFFTPFFSFIHVFPGSMLLFGARK